MRTPTDAELLAEVLAVFPRSTFTEPPEHAAWALTLRDGQGRVHDILVSRLNRHGVLAHGARAVRAHVNVHGRPIMKNNLSCLELGATLAAVSQAARPLEASFAVKPSGALVVTLADGSGHFTDFEIRGEQALQPAETVLKDLRARFQNGGEG